MLSINHELQPTC